MARVSNYLIFNGNAEAAFLFYQAAFKTNFIGEVARYSKMPRQAGQPPLSDAENQMLVHISLPTLGEHVIMGADVLPSACTPVKIGSSVHINLQPDTRTHADALFASLSQGGKVETPLQEMFWGDYYASFTDKFGICWMLNCDSKT